jgi:hypothetical protein
MGNWSEKRNPIPDKKDTTKFKDFLIQKYQNKQFSNESAIDSDSDSDDKKKKKAKKDKKKKKAAKKVESSSDDDSGKDQKENKVESDDEEIVVPTVVKEVKKGSRKLGAPPGFKPQ